MECDISYFCGLLEAYFDLTNTKQESYSEISKFWDYFTDRNRIVSFLLTLISKLIALDSGNAFRPLELVYKDLIFRCDRKEDFVQWEQMGGKLPGHYQEKAKALQRAIINNLYFIQSFYHCTNSGHLQKMYQRWKVARIATGRADNFEVAIMSSFGMLEVNLRQSPLRKVLGKDAKFAKGLDEIIIDLIDICLSSVGRGSLGQQPSLQCPLLALEKVSESLIYQKLMFKLQQSPLLMTVAVRSVLSNLINLRHKESTAPIKLSDGIEEESLIPLLNLYTELVTRAPVINKEVLHDAYEIIKPFYLWPYPHCEIARLALDFTQAEIIAPGIHYSRRMIAEHSLLEMSSIIKPHRHYVLVDGLAPNAPAFMQAFSGREEADKLELKKHILKHIYVCAYGGSFDLANFGMCLDHLDVYAGYYFEEVIQAIEGAFTEESGELKATLGQKLEEMHEKIMQHGRDKGMEVRSFSDNESKKKLDAFIHTVPLYPKVRIHELNSMTVPKSIESILRDILTREHLLTTSTIADFSESYQEVERSVDIVEISNMTQGKFPVLKSGIRDNTFNASMDALSSSVNAARRNSRQNLYRESAVRARPERNDSTQSSEVYHRIATHDLPTGHGRVMDNQSFEEQFRNRSINSFSRPSKTSLPTRSSRSEDSVDNKAVLERAEKIVKVIVVGTDKTIGQVTKAFIKLKHESPNIFSRQYPQIFYVPASSVDGMQLPSEKDIPVPELITQKHDLDPKIYRECDSSRGGDVWFGRFISHLDGWYNRNLMLATQAAVHLFPQVRYIPDERAPQLLSFRFTNPDNSCYNESQVMQSRYSPSKLIRDILFSFMREARCVFNLRVYHVEMLDTCGEAKYTIFSQRVELFHRQATMLGGMRSRNDHKNVSKPPCVSVRVWEVAFDGTPLNSVWYPLQRYFAIKALNIPRPGEGYIPNPERAGFEVSVTTCIKLTGLANSVRQRYGSSSDKYYHHSYQFEVRAKDRDNHFSVVVDGEAPFQHLVRLVVRPMESVISRVSDKRHRKRSKLSVPIMTFWPVDL